MMHLSELHGAATHLAVTAIPLFAVLYALRRSRVGGAAVVAAERWALAAAVIGVAAAGVTGLLVWGQAQTVLRGQAFRTGTAHFWLGIATAVIVVVLAGVQARAHFRGERPPHTRLLALMAAVAVAAVFVQGYLGGRMTYDQGVGIYDGGQYQQSAAGAQQLNLALARGAAPAQAGRQAFSAQGLGCARCHGDRAEGLRGPALAGGVDLDEFRGVHGHGLFPRSIVSDRDFRAIDAWLRTLPRTAGRGD